MRIKNEQDKFLAERAYSPYRKEVKPVIKIMLLLCVATLLLDPLRCFLLGDYNNHALLIAALFVMIPSVIVLHLLFVINVPWLSYVEMKYGLFVTKEIQLLWLKYAEDARSKNSRT